MPSPANNVEVTTMGAERKRYVAVVDDDESVARAFARLLRSVGYESITYPSAEAFLGDDKRPRFDCLVVDFQLKGISGLELGRRLAAVSDPTPVFLMTARDDPDDRAEAQAAGCAGYFRKSDLGSEILDRIRDCIQLQIPDRAHPSSTTCRSPLTDNPTQL